MTALRDGWSQPPVEELLNVDREFRRGALGGDSILHTEHGDRRYTALFSQTALAFQHGRQHDWVIIDIEVPGPNPRWTVVTERRGAMKGKRVVRGREVECFRLYQNRGGTRKPRRLPLGVPVFV